METGTKKESKDGLFSTVKGNQGSRNPQRKARGVEKTTENARGSKGVLKMGVKRVSCPMGMARGMVAKKRPSPVHEGNGRPLQKSSENQRSTKKKNAGEKNLKTGRTMGRGEEDVCRED